jgi:predicted nuclease of predicted toxin-antitoxin system
MAQDKTIEKNWRRRNNYIVVWLDQEFADELVCRTAAETHVSQVLCVDLQPRTAILNNGNRRFDII